ncbi:MAG: GGDEF domain-containing protein, partial [Deltaproteobacteria bacterium]|nr:GGDEF domain-containing protein [Deltaproteobacteria bacterium]
QWQQLSTAQQPLAIILCDIDFFKKYNDHYGHQEGDDCLVCVAQGLNNTLPDTTGLAARYGGEEFIFLLPNTTLESACIIAEEARKNVENLKIDHAGSDVAPHVTLSLGVSSIVPNDEMRALDLIKAADDALYRSKENGRNRVTTAEG